MKERAYYPSRPSRARARAYENIPGSGTAAAGRRAGGVVASGVVVLVRQRVGLVVRFVCLVTQYVCPPVCR